jgi:glucokinase
MLIGVDVGGTKIASGIVDEKGNISCRTRHPTDVGSPERTINSIVHAIQDTIVNFGGNQTDISASGLGIPGKVDSAKGIGILSVNLNWRNIPVTSMLEEQIHIPCFIENDVKAATLGEIRYGAGQFIHNLIYLSVGTGIAAGVVINGEIYNGSSGMAGEIGHAVIEPNGPRCKCGTRGCLEAVATGPAIAAQAYAAIQAGTATILKEMASQNDEQLTTEMVVQAAAQGDRVALAALDEAGHYLGKAIFNLILHYDPQMVLLGGGVSNAGVLILDPIRRELENMMLWSFSAREIINPDKVVLSHLGQDVAILGAAAVADRRIGRMDLRS